MTATTPIIITVFFVLLVMFYLYSKRFTRGSILLLAFYFLDYNKKITGPHLKSSRDPLSSYYNISIIKEGAVVLAKSNLQASVIRNRLDERHR
jgi:hypothetical protein